MEKNKYQVDLDCFVPRNVPKQNQSTDARSGSRDYLVIEPAEMQAMPRKKEETQKEMCRFPQGSNDGRKETQ